MDNQTLLIALLPTLETPRAIIGLVAGMAVMAMSLFLFI